MDWLQRLYHRIWTRLGDEPITWKLRDLWVKYEWIPMTAFFWSGVAIGVNFGWKWASLIWLVYSIGYLAGHCHWGDKFYYERIDDEQE